MEIGIDFAGCAIQMMNSKMAVDFRPNLWSRDAHHCELGQIFQHLLCSKGVQSSVDYEYPPCNFSFECFGIQVCVK